MFKLALKSLLGHKLRMLLTVFSIVIGVSFIAGTYIFTDSMSKTFEGIFDNAYASVDVTVRATPPEFGDTQNSSVPESLLETLKEIEAVDYIEPEVTGTAQLIDAEGDLIGGAGPPTLGYSWSDTEEFSIVELKEGGRAPEGPGEIVIDVNTAEISELKVGDTVSVQASGPVEQFEIVGLITFGEANTLAGATLSVFEFNEAQRIFGLEGKYTQINMIADEGVSAEELKAEVDSVISSEYESVTGQEQKDESAEELNEGLGFITTALLSFAGISIFVGAFIIQNTFRIIVAQRSKELALLRAIGSTRNQVIGLVVYEAFIVSVVSSALGLLTGVALANSIRALSNAIGLGLPTSDFVIESRTIYVSFAVGILVTLFSTLMPAIKASRVSPVEGLSENESAAPRKSLRKRALSGMAVTSVGAAALMYGLYSPSSNSLALVGFGVGVMFIGVSIIAPLLSKSLANIIGWPVAKRYGIVGRIAKENTKRTPRRTASTAAALMIGVSLVTLVSIFASSIKATIDQVIDGNFPGDIIITSKIQQTEQFGAGFSANVANDVDSLDEIEQVTRLKFNIVKINGEVEFIAAIEPETFNDAIFLDANNEYEDLDLNTVYVNEDKLESDNLEIGGTIDVEYALTGMKELKITGSFKEAYDSPYVISDETYALNFDSDKDLMVIANVADGVKHDDAMTAVKDKLKAYPVVQAQDKGEIITQTREQIDGLLALMSSLLGFAVIIAVLGITNTLTLSVTERTREIGMLRAIGMTRSHIRKMIRAEAIIIAVFGAVLGVVMGVFFGWALLQALEEVGLTSFSVPTAQIVSYLALSAFAGVIAAILPSFKASRMNVLDAINYE